MSTTPQDQGESEAAAPKGRTPGGSRELLALALPLVVSQGFMTVQVFVDTILLSWHDPREMAASFPAVMWFWLPFGLLQVTAGYVSTFVAQYSRAGRGDRHEHRAGAGPDLRPARLPRARNCGGRVGDRGRLVGVGPGGDGAAPG